MTSTTSSPICFWSILSIDDLKFVYIPSSISNTKILGQPIGDMLYHRSLFEFMHPNEIDLAKSDLSTFFRLKTLAGSVTRCRLLSLQTIANNPYTNNHYYFKSNSSSTSATNQKELVWNIIDLVIYTATDDTVLVCFHNTDLESYYQETDIKHFSSCQSRNSFIKEDASQLIQIMLERKESSPENETKTKTTKLPIRIFQIVDQMTGIPLFLWPPLQQQNSIIEVVQTISKEMLLKEFKSSSFDQQQNEISCTRHFYASSKQEFLNESCLFQRILIPYGNIIFESFQVSCLSEINSCSSLLYQHYYPDVPKLDHKAAIGFQEVSRDSSETSSSTTFYNSIHNIISSKPTTAAITTTELAIGEIETQILPGNLLAATVATRSQQQQIQQEDSEISCQKRSQFNNNNNNNDNNNSNLPSLFRKFRVRQLIEDGDDEEIISEFTAERKRKLAINSTATTTTTASHHHQRKQQQQQFLNQQKQQPLSLNDSISQIKVCTRCRASNSPEWRRGPDGHKTLCNACGLRYSRFRSKQWRTTTSNK